MIIKNEQIEQKYGDLKLTMENEGDGYFFWGYGLPSEYKDDKDIVKKFNEAESAIDGFKTLVEKRIIDSGGKPEEWIM